MPPPALSMDSGLSLCNGLLIKLFQAAHMRRKSTFRCGPQELSASGKIFRRLALYINNSRHLARKYARIFVRGHYLFREANSFPKAKLEENCEIRRTDNVQGQIFEPVFFPNGGFCLHFPSNLFRNVRSFENWGIFSDIPQF